MNIEDIRDYCLAKPAVEETFPFDDVTIVFKVMGKVFLLLSMDSIPLSINVKCDPTLALELREKYDTVIPGYHMNKKHWNTIIIDGSIPSTLILSFIDHSYDLIVASLPKDKKEALKNYF
ncbi:MAG: MmcQ/YjbR family DNA-binding protein [Bacteroidota bacterium]